MSDLLKEYDENTKKRVFYYSILKIAFWCVFVILGAIYFGNMLFGQSSLDTMLTLKNAKEEFNKKIAYLKRENAIAQKDYFELKGLYPDEKHK